MGKGVKRLPVSDETWRLVGIVSRSDLLKPFLSRDSAIRDEIKHDVLVGTLGLAPDAIDVSVEEGVVTLRGHGQRSRLDQSDTHGGGGLTIRAPLQMYGPLHPCVSAPRVPTQAPSPRERRPQKGSNGPGQNLDGPCAEGSRHTIVEEQDTTTIPGGALCHAL